MKELRTEIAIAASARRVFDILTDLERYECWNPLVVRACGQAAPNAKLRVRIRLPGRGEQSYRIKVLAVEPDRLFVWLGHFLIPGILDGKHFFEIHPDGPNRVRLVHREEFRGALIPLVWRPVLDTRMRDGFEHMNICLKTLAEHGSLPNLVRANMKKQLVIAGEV